MFLVIFAQPIIQIPSALLLKFTKSGSLLNRFAQEFSSGSATYLVVYAVLIMFFTFFWVATQFNAIEILVNTALFWPKIRRVPKLTLPLRKFA